jgi:2-methylcitrate dehydratase PrpD
MAASHVRDQPNISVRGGRPLETAILYFIHGFTVHSLDEGSKASARRLVQDQMGNQIACSQLLWCLNLLEYVRSQPRAGSATVAVYGDRMSASKVRIKPYLCCDCFHGYIDAVAPLAGRSDEIGWIDVRIQHSAKVPVGTKNANALTPTTIEHVQYSLPVLLAFTLLGMGNGYQVHLDPTEGRIDLSDDGANLRTARKVRMVEGPGLDLQFPGKFVADVTFRFWDGSSTQVFVEDSSGTIENPLSAAQLDGKFRELAIDVLGNQKTETLLAAIKSFDDQSAVSDFVAFAVK